jgi:deoxyribonuclease V
VSLSLISYGKIKEIDKLHDIISKIRFPKFADQKAYRYICACDVAYHETKGRRSAIAAAVLYDCISRRIVEKETIISQNPLPYVPGYFFARELPPIVSVLKKVHSRADLILVEGHGRLHPRRSGLAVYVGVFFDKPTLGVAKTLYVGQVSNIKQNVSEVVYENKVLGQMIFAPNLNRRYYVSVGYKMKLEKAVEIVTNLLAQGTDLIQEAHLLSKTLNS